MKRKQRKYEVLGECNANMFRMRLDMNQETIN